MCLERRRMNEGVGMKVGFRAHRGPGLDGPGGGMGRVVVSYWRGVGVGSSSAPDHLEARPLRTWPVKCAHTGRPIHACFG